MAKYLDENGVKTLWERIQKLVYECCNCSGGGTDAKALTEAEIDSVTPLGCVLDELGCEYYGTITATAEFDPV